MKRNWVKFLGKPSEVVRAGSSFIAIEMIMNDLPGAVLSSFTWTREGLLLVFRLANGQERELQIRLNETDDMRVQTLKYLEV